jgi:CPA2 family monovalent cation:H+ antiporter-2
LATIGLVLAVVLGKTLLAALAVWPSLRDPRLAFAVGLGLGQIGEFSVVVANEAARLGIPPGGGSKLFLAVAVPTMILTPGLNAISRRIAERCQSGCTDLELEGHLVIVGYGVNGRNVHRALRLLEVPDAVVDLNPHTIQELEENGDAAVYGDASQEAVLRAAGVHRARGVIIAIPDAAATRGVVQAVREIAPEVDIIARTRYVREVGPLEALGANQVIPEEFETSLELVGRVLEIYGAPPSVILEEKMMLRQQHYGVLRSIDHPGDRGGLQPFGKQLRLVELEVAAESAAAGRSLRDLDLRRITGATVLAVNHNGETSTNPSPDTVLEAGYRLVALADGECEAKLRDLVGTP